MLGVRGMSLTKLPLCFFLGLVAGCARQASAADAPPETAEPSPAPADITAAAGPVAAGPVVAAADDPGPGPEAADAGDAPSGGHLFRDTFTAPDGLISNEYAYWNPTHADAVVSAGWEMNSGSLFNLSGAAWSGVPDGIGPNAGSTGATDSSVFRMMTKRADFGDVAVSFDLRNDGLVTTARTPAVDWDGIHLWLRYQAENSMYYASVNRRDGTVVLKKKVPGGPTNDGTYYLLSKSVAHAVPYGTWQHVEATVKNEADGSVTVALYADGALLVSANDVGLGGPPLRAPGKLGIRADNCNFRFDDFTVDAL